MGYEENLIKKILLLLCYKSAIRWYAMCMHSLQLFFSCEREKEIEKSHSSSDTSILTKSDRSMHFYTMVKLTNIEILGEKKLNSFSMCLIYKTECCIYLSILIFGIIRFRFNEYYINKYTSTTIDNNDSNILKQELFPAYFSIFTW